jgi:hypothetical protein
LGVVAHLESGKLDNIMSFVTGFIVYGLLIWCFVAVLALIVARDHFVRPISFQYPTGERPSKKPGPSQAGGT